MEKKQIIAIVVAVLVILLIIVLAIIFAVPKKSNIVEPTPVEAPVEEELPKPEDEKLGTINEEGDFNLKVPQVHVLQDSTQKYNDVLIGSSFEDAKEKLGEPLQKDEYKVLTYYTWNLDESGNIKLKVSVKNEENKVSEKTLLLFSNADEGYQISKELGTEIQDLQTEMEKINEGMTLDEVIQILGEKYIEESCNEENYKIYVWYDINENSVELSFNEENVLVQKTIASYKG